MKKVASDKPVHPQPPGAPEPARIEVCAAVVRSADRFLLARRAPGAHLEGAWEFPGGKPKNGETHAECLERELMEELGLAVRVGKRLAVVDHDYPEKRIRLFFYACTPVDSRTAAGREGQEFGWFAAEEISSLDLAPADRSFVKKHFDPAGIP